MKIYTFWEGAMPEYIKLCMNTWKFEYVLLNYSNLNDYTDLNVEKIKRFTLPQISDIVRVHVLRDNGGIWTDADTIMIGETLPEENMVGIPETRGAHCGYLNFEKEHPMLIKWARHQDSVINSDVKNVSWDTFVNSFSDKYIQRHEEITIRSRRNIVPESYMIKDDLTKQQYLKFYFESKYHLSDIEPTEMIMLHNSWTPKWYKDLSKADVLKSDLCTMSNILKEVLA